MANSVIRGFRGLARFSGRDTRAQFWPFAALVIVTVFLAGAAAMSWAMEPMFREMARFAAEHPEAATVHSAPGQYSVSIDAGHPDAPQMDFSRFFGVLVAMVAAAVALLAAAVARRLHDSNRRGWWGLMPLPFIAFSMTAFPVMMKDFMANPEPNLGLFLAALTSNLLYLASLGVLIVLLCLTGTDGPNRFGDKSSD